MADTHPIARPKAWTFVDGEWREGNTPLYGALTHAAWLGSMVFDGARRFEGVAPDLDLHCARVVGSCQALGLESPAAAGLITEIAEDGMTRFEPDEALYIRPTIWAEAGTPFMVAPDPSTCRFAVTIFAAPMRPYGGVSITTTRFRRPTIECMPTNAKAGCLYPNNARMLKEANEKGFDNALVQDALGNVAELATANVFLAKDGVVATPIPNGTFLNGITRQRVISLLREAGYEVRETTLTVQDFRDADEIFTTGNALKVAPITRFDDRELNAGPITGEARQRYWDWAHA